MNKLANLVIILFIFVGCEGPQDVPAEPPHASRVPSVLSFQAEKDTLPSGKAQILLTWNATDTVNLKSFEIFRSLNLLSKFKLEKQTAGYKMVDSFAVSAIDSVAYYYISTIGRDLFIGKNSDTILVNIKR
ncbi:MAG: hypothetical protein HYV28_04690 [Ignavibacteriales bacterium]|nr:hypothetical protein [Ignavibacteriales bacterium]